MTYPGCTREGSAHRALQSLHSMLQDGYIRIARQPADCGELSILCSWVALYCTSQAPTWYTVSSLSASCPAGIATEPLYVEFETQD